MRNMFIENEMTVTSVEYSNYRKNVSDHSLHPNAYVVRIVRDRLIASTDWWATTDRTMSAEQTAYRQALRDITAQSGFPTEVVWPTKPE